MNGCLGIGLRERRMAIPAGRNVSEQGHVDQASEVARKMGEPLGGELLDDALILIEALKGFHEFTPCSNLGGSRWKKLQIPVTRQTATLYEFLCSSPTGSWILKRASNEEPMLTRPRFGVNISLVNTPLQAGIRCVTPFAESIGPGIGRPGVAQD